MDTGDKKVRDMFGLQQDGTERLNAHQDENLPRVPVEYQGQEHSPACGVVDNPGCRSRGYLGLLFGYFPGYSGYVADNFRDKW